MQRTLSLVGESLPEGKVVQVGDLKTLEPLDARHGVYPNLVMSPLMSALWALNQMGENSEGFWKQVESLLNSTANRFNVFKKMKSPNKYCHVFEILPDAKIRILEFCMTSQLWLLFGYQTVFGLFRWILIGEVTATTSQIKRFAIEFLSAASNQPVPRKKSAQEGLVHRLCTHAQQENNLRQAILKNTKFPNDAERHLNLFRCFIPLLHNEAYQLVPYGIGQANFSLARDYDHNGEEHAGELYWKVMGNAIAARLQNKFVEPV